MTSTEGSREIKAARERLVAVKKLSSSVAKAYQAAKDTEDAAKKVSATATESTQSAKAQYDASAKAYDAAKNTEGVAKEMSATVTKSRQAIQSQYNVSIHEVNEAQKCLKEAEERWEVVKIETDDESEEGGPSKKKQKNSFVEEIEVHGCGVEEANGTYTLIKYGKCGDRNMYHCKDNNFMICYSESENRWEFCIHSSCASLYVSNPLYVSNCTASDVPPKNGWARAFEEGDGAPQLQY